MTHPAESHIIPEHIIESSRSINKIDAHDFMFSGYFKLTQDNRSQLCELLTMFFSQDRLMFEKEEFSGLAHNVKFTPSMFMKDFIEVKMASKANGDGDYLSLAEKIRLALIHTNIYTDILVSKYSKDTFFIRSLESKDYIEHSIRSAGLFLNKTYGVTNKFSNLHDCTAKELYWETIIPKTRHLQVLFRMSVGPSGILCIVFDKNKGRQNNLAKTLDSHYYSNDLYMDNSEGGDCSYQISKWIASNYEEYFETAGIFMKNKRTKKLFSEYLTSELINNNSHLIE